MSYVTHATHENLHPFEDLEGMSGLEDGQATVRMDRYLKQQIEDWIKSEEGKRKGYKSLAQFVNKAARDMYEREATREEKPTHFILPNLKEHHLTLDLDIFHDRVYCNMCQTDNCIHVKILKTDRVVKRYLKKYNIEAPN